MGRSSTAFSLFLITGVIGSSAFAQVPGDRNDAIRLADPIDGHRFEWSVPLSTNALGGWDSDGCTYSSSEQPRTTGVATSPTTLYSRPIELFDQPIPTDKVEGLTRMLLGIGENVDEARRLAPFQRYEIAAAVGAWLGDLPFATGELYLTAAWTVRDTIVGFLPGILGASDAWQKLAETLPRLAEIDNDRGRTIAAFDMARLCHRAGLVHERDAFLAAVDGWPDEVGGLVKRDEFHRRVAEENRLLAKARDAFRAGVQAGDGEPIDRAYYRYLIGELSRRLGDFETAETQLESVALDAAAAEEVKAYVTDIQAVLKVQGRSRSAVDTRLEGSETPR
jgi:hypothetical protein